MKSNIRHIVLVFAAILCISSASAQYYQLANQLPGLLQPALSGSLNYKGFLEAGYSKSIGNNDADFFEISTSQGFRYSNWFYMGAGLGVDIVSAHKSDTWGNGWETTYGGFDYRHPSTTSAVMMPVFTDFRLSFGGSVGASFFVDLKTGCSFLLGNKYIAIGNGYITNREYFYLRPSLGLRIPVNVNNPSQAVNIALTYKLLTSNYWNSHSSNITLSSFGATLSYEW